MGKTRRFRSKGNFIWRQTKSPLKNENLIRKKKRLQYQLDTKTCKLICLLAVKHQSIDHIISSQFLNIYFPQKRLRKAGVRLPTQ
jgi:hypothetical protein